MRSNSQRNIERLSRFLKLIFISAACLLPVITAGFWITDGYPFLEPWMRWDLLPNISDALIKPLSELSSANKFLGFLVTLIPTSINMLTFLFLAKLFKHFESLEIFSKTTVKNLRQLGFCILFNQLLYPFYMGLLSLTLTFSNPPGYRQISVGFGLSQLNLLIIGAMIILISWVMEEGRKLQEEQEATI